MTLTEIHDKYYSAVPLNVFHDLVAADPTYNAAKPAKKGRYADWLLRRYRNGALSSEDMYKVPDYLRLFDAHKSKLAQRDIGQYPTLADVYDAIKPFTQDSMVSLPLSRKQLKLCNARHEYEDAHWVVVEPLTWEASKLYGSHTQWCTASKYSDSYFDGYTNKGLLLIFIHKDSGQKYQMHFLKSDQFNICCDASDRVIDPYLPDMTDGLANHLDSHYTFRYIVKRAMHYSICRTSCRSQNIFNNDDVFGSPLVDRSDMCSISPILRGMFCARLVDGSWILINSDYQVIDTADFHITSRPTVSNGIIIVREGRRLGAVDQQGRFKVVSDQIDSMGQFDNNGQLVFWSNGRFSVMDLDLNVHTDYEYISTHLDFAREILVVFIEKFDFYLVDRVNDGLLE